MRHLPRTMVIVRRPHRATRRGWSRPDAAWL